MSKATLKFAFIGVFAALSAQAETVSADRACPFESPEFCDVSADNPRAGVSKPTKTLPLKASGNTGATLADTRSVTDDIRSHEGEDIFFDSFEACIEFFEAYPDMDGDSWGAEVDPTVFCNRFPHNFVLNTGDCDDTSSLIFPGHPELCDDLDNDCSGIVDDNVPADGFEINNSCGNANNLISVGSSQTISYNTMTIYPQTDQDYYLIPAEETDSTCECCDFFCTDEDYQLVITLHVPQDAGSYIFCTGDPCASVNDDCMEIPAGQQNSWIWTFDGACLVDDSFDVYVRIYGDNAPGSECKPYTLSYWFTPGCF